LTYQEIFLNHAFQSVPVQYQPFFGFFGFVSLHHWVVAADLLVWVVQQLPFYQGF